MWILRKRNLSLNTNKMVYIVARLQPSIHNEVVHVNAIKRNCPSLISISFGLLRSLNMKNLVLLLFLSFGVAHARIFNVETPEHICLESCETLEGSNSSEQCSIGCVEGCPESPYWTCSSTEPPLRCPTGSLVQGTMSSRTHIDNCTCVAGHHRTGGTPAKISNFCNGHTCSFRQNLVSAQCATGEPCPPTYCEMDLVAGVTYDHLASQNKNCFLDHVPVLEQDMMGREFVNISTSVLLEDERDTMISAITVYLLPRSQHKHLNGLALTVAAKSDYVKLTNFSYIIPPVTLITHSDQAAVIEATIVDLKYEVRFSHPVPGYLIGLMAETEGGHGIFPVRKVEVEVTPESGSCEPCGRMHFCPDEVQRTLCPPNSMTWLLPTASSKEECFCKMGYIRDIDSGECTECNSTQFCSGEIEQSGTVEDMVWDCNYDCSAHGYLVSRCSLGKNMTCLDTREITKKTGDPARTYDSFKFTISSHLSQTEEHKFLEWFRYHMNEPAIYMVYVPPDTDEGDTGRRRLLQNDAVYGELRIPVKSDGSATVQSTKDVETILFGLSLLPKNGNALTETEHIALVATEITLTGEPSEEDDEPSLNGTTTEDKEEDDEDGDDSTLVYVLVGSISFVLFAVVVIYLLVRRSNSQNEVVPMANAKAHMMPPQMNLPGYMQFTNQQYAMPATQLYFHPQQTSFPLQRKIRQPYV